jgi:hypothetical protein
MIIWPSGNFPVSGTTMSLENFALLAGLSVTIGAASDLTTLNPLGSPVADIGLGGALSIGVLGTTTVQGKVRFSGASVIANAGTLTDSGVTQDDTLTGIIQTIPALIQSYMALAPEAIQILNNSPFGVTVDIYPGVNSCPSSYTADNASFQFCGSPEDTYIILIDGDATFDDSQFNQSYQNILVVITGSLFFGTFIGPPPSNVYAGTFLFGGSDMALQGGSLTVNPGRIIGTPISNFSIGNGLSASITAPSFIAPMVIQATALAFVPLPNPRSC